jgi:glycyl-tRNA synthetase beta subunit
VVALADKLETLAGLFGIGQQPSGDKDPFALRRHALGVVRMLVEGELALDVPALLDAAFAAFPAGHGDARAELQQFHGRAPGRLPARARLHRARGRGGDRAAPDALGRLPARLAAVRAFAALPEAAPLAAATSGSATSSRRPRTRCSRASTRRCCASRRRRRWPIRWPPCGRAPTPPSSAATMPPRCRRWRR